MEKKKRTPQKARRPAESKPPLRRKKRKSVKAYLPSIVLAIFILIFLLWRIIILIPKGKEVREFQKEASTKVEQVEAKRERKKENKKKSSENPVDNNKVEIKKFQEENKKEKTLLNKEEEIEKSEKEKKPILTDKNGDTKKLPTEAKCSIVIDDVGSSLELLEYAIKVLPKTTTFAVIPFQKYSLQSAELLHKEGFHIILHSPMEAEETGFYYNPQYVLKPSMTKQEVEKTLRMQFDSV
ncbi:MAG: divergent polysaccharide deacetylase family protein, partial [Acidobacteria bacterium]|nr:divergent polysaccharide deacetylase family protein [Acidobacteriota bacterium]